MLAKRRPFGDHLTIVSQAAPLEGVPPSSQILVARPTRPSEPVSLVAEPGVVEDRCLGVGEPRRDDQRPVGVTTPLSERVHRMPARQHRIVGTLDVEHGAEEDSTDARQLVDDTPQTC